MEGHSGRRVGLDTALAGREGLATGPALAQADDVRLEQAQRAIQSASLLELAGLRMHGACPQTGAHLCGAEGRAALDTRVLAMSRGLINLTGRRFGRLTVRGLAEDVRAADGSRMWVCDCGCGAQALMIRGANLRDGHSKSCGCLRSDRLRRRHRAGTWRHARNQNDEVDEFLSSDA